MSLCKTYVVKNQFEIIAKLLVTAGFIFLKKVDRDPCIDATELCKHTHKACVN